MIKTGEMTPFGTVVKQEKEAANEGSEPRPSDTVCVADTADVNKSVSNSKAREEKNSSKQSNDVSAHGFDNDDMYDAEIEEPGNHSDKDNEWLPSNQDKGSHSDEEMAVGVKEERGNLYCALCDTCIYKRINTDVVGT